ncbi:hypothetical protein A2Y83_04770 [Candidatus Falkowbacteria bacterium RBG_13_39_14]|uniref:Uncharacterized protein n=1 Tax=Candidatus Falkowbacteria bacterium RBG_13_39_14 TaxID=1797985 RepID=A0A1F5S189_9BACT|nr:MAG: hypothetical protein A2Y83_04770 [Candidatus Falkowbacteria bacterium RBG_13_39_14]
MRELFNIELSKHAINQMRERNISIVLVRETVEEPDRIIIQRGAGKRLKLFERIIKSIYP